MSRTKNTPSFDRLYEGLANNWLNHERVRRANPAYAELVDSWLSVEAARNEMRQWRVQRNQEIR